MRVNTKLLIYPSPPPSASLVFCKQVHFFLPHAWLYGLMNGAVQILTDSDCSPLSHSSSGELWFPHEPSAASEGSEVQHAQQRAGDHCHRGTLGVKVSLGICVFLKNLIQSCRLMHLPSPLGNCCHTINLPAEVLDFCSMSITHPVHFFSKLAYLLF